MKKLDLSKYNLKEMYEDKQMSTRDIASQLGIGQTTVRRALARLGIVLRENSESRHTDKYKSKYDVLKKFEERICPHCGTTFSVTPHIKKKYCSKGCSSKALAEKSKKRVIVLCAYCGEETEKIPSHVADGKNNFCSTACHGKWKSEHLVGEASPTYSKVKTTCSACGNEIAVVKSVYGKHSHNYCSVECMGIAYRERLLGDANPHWKGGRHGRSEYGPTWWEARRKTLARDANTCQLCKVKEDDLEEALSVHHIRPFRLWRRATEANQLSNLVALCRPCHSFVHSNANKEKIYLIDE